MSPALPEFDFLCAAVRPLPNLLQLHDQLARRLDFPVLLRLAQAHGVRPRLVQALSALNWQNVPAKARSELEGFRQRHLVRTVTMVDQHGRIADALLKERIAFAFFKGAALAVDLYGDPSHREYGDLDLIVMPHQVTDAEEVLEKLGYLTRQGDRAFRQTFLSYQRQYTFVRTDVGATIDLHWGFSAGPLPFPLNERRIWGKLKPVRIGSRSMPTLADDDLALLLAGHGTKETWRSLAWVCDFAMLIDRRPDLDWPDLYRRARQQGCGNALLIGAAMVSWTFNMEVPLRLGNLLKGRNRILRTARRLLDRMRGAPDVPSQGELTDLGLCDRSRDRVRAVMSFAFTPTAGDYHALPLPASLWGAYYFTRPVRLAARTVGLTRRRSPADDRAADGTDRLARPHQTS